MTNSETRLSFRILAGLIGLFLLCFSLPVSLLDAQIGFLERIFFVACSFIGGIGLVTAACTGRWFRSAA
jgi:hypothetical protein